MFQENLAHFRNLVIYLYITSILNLKYTQHITNAHIYIYELK